MRRETTAAQEVGARRETLDASEARHEIRDVRRVSSLSSRNLVSRLTSHATAPWPKVRLGDVGRVVTGLTPPTKHSEYFGDRFLFVTPSDLRYDSYYIANSERKISDDGYTKFSTRFIPAGSVMYTCIASIGKVGISRSEVLTNQQINSIVPNVDTDCRFLYYLLRHLTPNIQQQNAGCAVPIINKGDFESFQIPLPPLPVQRRIADILSAYDDLIENNRRRIAILEETARLTYRKWFGGSGAKGGMRHETIDELHVSRLTSHAQLRTVTLGEICREVRRGVNPDAIAPDTPYIGLEHMPRRSISLCEWESAQKVTSTKLSFEAGDILFGKIRPYFHKVGIAFVDGVASSDAIVIKPNRPELLAYVLMTVSSDAFVAAASQGMKEGSKMPRADWKQLLRYCVVLPDAETLSAFNKVLNPILAQLKALCFSSRTLAAARDMLLPRLFTHQTN